VVNDTKVVTVGAVSKNGSRFYVGQVPEYMDGHVLESPALGQGFEVKEIRANHTRDRIGTIGAWAEVYLENGTILELWDIERFIFQPT
jgi:hypothetical protein